MAKINYCFGYNNTWLEIKGIKYENLLLIFPELKNARKTTWEKGILEIQDSRNKIFFSGIYEGWSFLISRGLYDPSQTERVITLLLQIGEFAEEVCYFSSYRTVGLYGFAKVSQKKIVRLYFYTGETGQIYKNIGEVTEQERNLQLNLAPNDEELFEEDFEEIDEDRILELAEQFALSPQQLLDMDEKESFIANIF